MHVRLNLKTIKFYLIKLATDFVWQSSYLVGERASLRLESIGAGFAGQGFFVSWVPWHKLNLINKKLLFCQAFFRSWRSLGCWQSRKSQTAEWKSWRPCWAQHWRSGLNWRVLLWSCCQWKSPFLHWRLNCAESLRCPAWCSSPRGRGQGHLKKTENEETNT